MRKIFILLACLWAALSLNPCFAQTDSTAKPRDSTAKPKDSIPGVRSKGVTPKPNGLPGGGGDPGGGDPGGGGGGGTPSVSCSLSGPTSVPAGSQQNYTLSCTGDPGGVSWSVSGGTVVFTQFITNGQVVTVQWTDDDITTTGSVTAVGWGTKTTLITYPPFSIGTLSGAQSIYAGQTPVQLSLGNYSGGVCSTPSYTWYSSTDGSNFTPIPGASGRTYSPGPLSVNTWYKVNGLCGNTSSSNITEVTMLDPLNAGSITPAQVSIITGNTSGTLQLNGVSGGDHSYSYQWKYTNGDPANLSAYSLVSSDPNIYNQTMYITTATAVNVTYRVWVTSHGLTAVSAPSTTTVFPPLQAGTISGPATVTNTNIVSISQAAAPGGGICSGNYGYQWWVYSYATSSWTQITSQAGSSAIIGTLPLGQVMVLRRVFCGSDQADYTIMINVIPGVQAGVVSATSQSVELGSDPGLLNCTTATNGNCGGSYGYTWQRSTDGINFLDATGNVNGLSYDPGMLTVNTWFRMHVHCGAEDVYSNSVEITINPAPNYIRTRTIQKPGVTDKATADGLTETNEVQQTTVYYDGLGRSMETVSKGASPLGYDLVMPQVYDPLGREVMHYLPYVAQQSNGTYKADFAAGDNAFNSAQFPNDGSDLAGQTRYELSPLNRPTAVYAPGSSWVGDGRGVTMGYFANGPDDNVRIWNIDPNAGSLPVSPGTYPAGQLYKNLTVDEQGHQTVQYVDKEGHTILKKVQLQDNPGIDHNGWLCTYYVYDYLGNQRFVLPPKVVEQISGAGWTVTQDLADALCFRYEYDARNRIIIKKKPGAGEERSVYDARDRIVMTQDANLRGLKQYAYLQYDDLDRLTATGILSDNDNYDNLAYHSQLAYNDITYPHLVSYFTQQMARTFYDNYNWTSSYGAPFTGTRNSSADPYFPAASNSYPYEQSMAQDMQTTGLVTGSMERVIGTSDFIFEGNFYDARSRQIQSGKEYSGHWMSYVQTQYDLMGKTLGTYEYSQDPNATPSVYSVLTTNNYDAMGRLLNIQKNVNNTGVKTLATYTYNELSQLNKKDLGGLESLAYEYNIRGWMTNTNKNYLNGKESHYFAEELGYDKSSVAVDGVGFGTAQYSGNIAGTLWKSAGDQVIRKYAFSYDDVNRLTGADFTQQSNGSWGKSLDFTVTIPGYDANGNIMQMKQQGWRAGSPAATIDDLHYSYVGSGNLLKEVTDADPTDYKLGDFHYDPAVKTGTDYSYDGNGNVTGDVNKGISSITYNYLNLPQQVTFIKSDGSAKGNIVYQYDALGAKLSKTVTDLTVSPAKVSTTLYIRAFNYQDNVLHSVGHEEGQIRYAKQPDGSYTSQYDYFIKDHLGNTRTVLTDETTAASYTATMESAYRDNENLLFYNIDATSTAISNVPGYPGDVSVTNPNNNVAKVNGNGQKQGPAIILKVMSGDQITMGTQYYYNAMTPGSPVPWSATDLLSSLANGVFSMTGGSHGTLAQLQNASGGPLAGALTSYTSSSPAGDPGKPQAYLNWILLDNQLNYVSDQSGAIQIGDGGLDGANLRRLAQGITLKHSGYLYIYVSNVTPGDVFFDNLSVAHVSGPMLEENHYYPFGLTMAGLSDKALKANYTENKYRANGGSELQNKEFSDGSGLETYDATFRMYDPQIGRFMQQDPLTDYAEGWSPYTFVNDNPMSFSDPLGLADSLPTVTVTQLNNYTGVRLANTSGGGPNVSAGPAPASVGAPIDSDAEMDDEVTEEVGNTTTDPTPTPTAPEPSPPTAKPNPAPPAPSAIKPKDNPAPAPPSSIKPASNTSYLDKALKYPNVPYVSGGASPKGYDCSGLICMVAGAADHAWSTGSDKPPPGNWSLIHPTHATYIRFIGDVQRGDLFVWKGEHTAFYAGPGAYGNGIMFGAHRTGVKSGYTKDQKYWNEIRDYWVPRSGFPAVYRQN